MLCINSPLQKDHPRGAIDHNTLPCSDAFCRTRHPDNCRDAVFTGNDGTVGYSTSHFHDQTARRKEERRPAWIGRRSNQDFAWF